MSSDPIRDEITGGLTLTQIHETHRARLREFHELLSETYPYWQQRNSYFQRDSQSYHQFAILPGSSVLEIGCRTGDLLASLKPSNALGIELSDKMIEVARRKHPHCEFMSGDFTELSIDETFDFIVISNSFALVDDVQLFLHELSKVCAPHTRIIVYTHNPKWQLILKLAEKLKLKQPDLLLNWFPTADLENLFRISGFDVIRTHYRLLLPIYIPVISTLLNRILAKLWPFRGLCLGRYTVARLPQPPCLDREPSCSIVMTVRDERDNIEPLIQRTALLGDATELIFSEGHSTDGTKEEIERCIVAYPHRNIILVVQDGIGQGDAMRKGFARATGDIILWLEGDLTTPPEEITKLWTVLAEGKGEFVNGSRLVYPMPKGAMPFLNKYGNRFFGYLFTWLLEQPFRDTLCGLKGMTQLGYKQILSERGYFGDFDPFGDFEILFGAAKRNLKIIEVPVHYRPRAYGTTKIRRFKDGWLLLKMSWLALWRLKLL